ncbi:MAG: rhodanese-like domain-containing protein [Campylobacterales bacterium]|nr:rhodanese-like domain-containing protein [Campylobacterales bacterium]
MFTDIVSLGIPLSLVLLVAYSKGWIFANFKSITPAQASELLKNNKEVFLLDVRTPAEFSQERIKGSTLIPLHDLSQSLSKLNKVKDKTVIVYCRSGNRSVSASRILAKNGFIPLNLKGGIGLWQNEGLSVIR